MTELKSRRGSSYVDPASASPTEIVDRGVGRVEPRGDTIDRWSAALSRGDDAEVDRLVRQSRMDRAWVAASGQIGAMSGEASPAVSDEGAKWALLPRPDLWADVTVTHQAGGVVSLERRHRG